MDVRLTLHCSVKSLYCPTALQYHLDQKVFLYVQVCFWAFFYSRGWPLAHFCTVSKLRIVLYFLKVVKNKRRRIYDRDCTFSAKPNLFTSWPFTDKVCQLLFYSIGHFLGSKKTLSSLLQLYSKCCYQLESFSFVFQDWVSYSCHLQCKFQSWYFSFQTPPPKKSC